MAKPQNLKKINYFKIDSGFFPVEIKLCFDDKEFQQVLKDYGIKQKVSALEIGCAETHYFNEGKSGLVILVFDLNTCGSTNAELVGAVVHEATHCVARISEHIGETNDNMGEETKAYLTEHLCKQIWAGIEIKKERDARERDRSVSEQKGKRSKGSNVQMDINSDRSAGQDSNTQQQNLSSGTQDSNGNPFRASEGSV